jgi:hypothetical protein
LPVSKLPEDRNATTLLRLTVEQFIQLDDGHCPFCNEPLADDRSKRCIHCGNGPFDGEVELNLSGR